MSDRGTPTLYGREVLYTDAEEITQENVVEKLKEVIPAYERNRGQIEYLYKYYRGRQPVIDRKKEIRPDIKNVLVENRANEIVSFKTGFLIGEPIQYVNRGGDDGINDDIELLNEYVFAENKILKDKELVEWFSICGVAYRLVLPDKMAGEKEEDESPFEVFTLDPRDTFVVYHNGIRRQPVMGVYVIQPREGNLIYNVYTENEFFEIQDDDVQKVEPHILKGVPIIEYMTSPARLGEFEIVVPLLDAINQVGSNRLDGIEQFVEALMVIKGMDIKSEELAELQKLGGIKVPADGDVKYLVQELNQTQTQTIVDYMYEAVLTICGMPNRNGGHSTSDTGRAVIFRDGWTSAEARAKERETQFKESEKRFLKFAVRICKELKGSKLKLSDIDIRFTRRNFENILEKTQVLLMMLASGKVHPRLAFSHSGMFADPDLAYTMSRDWWEENEAKMAQELSEGFESARLDEWDNRTRAEGGLDVQETGQDAADNQ